MIEVDRVHVASGDVTLLAPVSIMVQPGELLVLRGKNGSGKTTLLRALAGLIRPTAGSVRIGGEPVDERDPAFRRRVASMIGIPPMAQDLTLHDHLALVATTWPLPRTTVPHRVDEALAAFGLTALATRFPHELSSGQRQLFGIALSLIRPFDVALLDEPEQRLDPERQNMLIDALRQHRERGATLALASHSDRLTQTLADRVHWLPSDENEGTDGA